MHEKVGSTLEKRRKFAKTARGLGKRCTNAFALSVSFANRLAIQLRRTTSLNLVCELFNMCKIGTMTNCTDLHFATFNGLLKNFLLSPKGQARELSHRKSKL